MVGNRWMMWFKNAMLQFIYIYMKRNPKWKNP